MTISLSTNNIYVVPLHFHHEIPESVFFFSLSSEEKESLGVRQGSIDILFLQEGVKSPASASTNSSTQIIPLTMQVLNICVEAFGMCRKRNQNICQPETLVFRVCYPNPIWQAHV